MFEEKHNGENPEELESAGTCETTEETELTEQETAPEVTDEETVEAAEEVQESAEEETAEEPEQDEVQKPEKDNKLQEMLTALKEKCAVLAQKVRSLIPEKKQAEETEVEETLTEDTAEETAVEETPAEVTVEEVAVVETSAEEADEETAVENESADDAAEETETEETAEEETATEETAEELPADETEELAPEKKKINRLHLGMMIAGGVILLGLLVFVILRATGIDLKPRANDLFCKNSYAAEDGQLEKKADTVIATIGDKELTVSELQLYYINSIYSFYSQNYYYLEYMGLDLSVPLSEQVCTLDETMTWEQYFLDGTIKSWQSYALVELMAEQDEFMVSPEAQTQIDSMGQQLESIAVAYGYEDAASYLSAEMAPGVSPETYLHFNEVYYVTNEYLNRFYTEDYPTDAEIMIFHAQNRETFEANGITPDMGLLSDVRHILIQPQGGTVSEDGMETVYSEDEWTSALSEAERILEAWKSGEATEESFAAMANTYSEDGGSNTTGGLYEDINPFSNYVPEFLSWAVDMSRQPGDTGIVKTVHGYHIMYFVGGEDYFDYTVGEQLVAERIQTKLEQIKTQYPLEVNYKKILLCEPAF